MKKEDIKNGTIWRARWPLCWTVVLQWIDIDVWLILSAPERARGGGTCQMSYGLPCGKDLLTREEVLGVLRKWKATKLDATLVLVEEEP
jgi:hypothetical protein